MEKTEIDKLVAQQMKYNIEKRKWMREVKFIHILTLLIAGTVIAFDVLLCFHEIPATNKSIVDFIAGVLNGTCLGAAIAYWYNSTASSKEKTKEMIELAKNVPAPEQEKK